MQLKVSKSQKCEYLDICVQWISMKMGNLRVIPATAHAAFDKGASYLGVKVHTIPVNNYTRRVDLNWVKRAM